MAKMRHAIEPKSKFYPVPLVVWEIPRRTKETETFSGSGDEDDDEVGK